MVILLGKQSESPTTTTFNPKVAHPLDPLRADEINKAASIVKKKAGLGDRKSVV